MGALLEEMGIISRVVGSSSCEGFGLDVLVAHLSV